MVKAFISYSHVDVRYKDELEKHLATLRRNGEMESWTDTMISPSEVWNESISKSLNSADLIICLISSDFINSDYCYDIEMRDALIRHKEGKAQIIPIIIRSCDWSDTPFAHIQVLPTLGKPIREWADQDQAYLNVIEGLKKSIRAMSQPPALAVVSAQAGTIAGQTNTEDLAATPKKNDSGLRPGYENPISNNSKIDNTPGYVDYMPGPEKVQSRKPSRKMTYVYAAATLILLFVVWRLVSGSHTVTDGNLADENLEKFEGLTNFIAHYSPQQLLITCLICAVAGKMVCDLIGSANSLLVSVLIGIAGGLIGLWLFGDYLSVTGNMWLNMIITIVVSVLILALPIKLIRGLFKS
jgi:TIR domain-containing protein